MRRTLCLRLAIAAMLAQTIASPALAAPPEVKVMQPPGFDLETLKAVLTDPKPSVGGAVITVAALAIWSGIGSVMADSKMCYEAYGALSSTTHHQFSVKVTVVNVGGDPVMSYTQSYLAVYAAGGVAYSPIIVYADGRVVTGPIKYCSGGRSWNFPLTAERLPTAGPAHTRVGIHHIALESRQGRVIVRLPEDIRAGDTISGTVLIEPQGATDAERVANAATLEGMVIEIDGKQNRVADGKVLISISQAGGMVPLLLRDAAANPAGLMGIAATPADVPGPPQPQTMPPASQAGLPLNIPGSFDGNAANTTATLNGQPVQIIAESPRQAVVDCPPGMTGPASVTVSDPVGTVTRQTNLVGLSLSTPRTTLMRGEKTVVTLRVAGLEGLQQRLDVAVQASPSVRLEGGNAQTVAINPAGATGGVTVRQFGLTMNAPGPFDVNARLLEPGETAPAPAPAPAATPQPRRRIGM